METENKKQHVAQPGQETPTGGDQQPNKTTENNTVIQANIEPQVVDENSEELVEQRGYKIFDDRPVFTRSQIVDQHYSATAKCATAIADFDPENPNEQPAEFYTVIDPEFNENGYF